MTGAQLRAARHRLGLSQGQLAKRLHISSARLCQWEKGRQPIPAERQMQIGTLFALLLRSPFVVNMRIPCPHCAGAGMFPAVYTLDGGLVPASEEILDGRSRRHA